MLVNLRAVLFVVSCVNMYVFVVDCLIFLNLWIVSLSNVCLCFVWVLVVFFWKMRFIVKCVVVGFWLGFCRWWRELSGY